MRIFFFTFTVFSYACLYFIKYDQHFWVITGIYIVQFFRHTIFIFLNLYFCYFILYNHDRQSTRIFILRYSSLTWFQFNWRLHGIWALIRRNSKKTYPVSEALSVSLFVYDCMSDLCHLLIVTMMWVQFPAEPGL